MRFFAPLDFRKFARDSDSLRKLVGFSTAGVSLAVFSLNFLTLLNIGKSSGPEILARGDLLVIMAFGILAMITAIWKSRFSEWLQILILFATAFISVLGSKPGDLTSAFALVFALVLAVEYEFGRTSLLVCAAIALLGYPILLAITYSAYSQSFLSQTATAMVAILFFITLYGGVLLRHRARHREEAERLEEKVKERTVELEILLSERVAMLNEIHHRVKNNLQLVASLLRLGSDGKADSELRGAYVTGVRRIDAMALVHDCLYDTERLDIVDLGNYARRLLEAISEESGFHFDFSEEEPVRGRLDIAVPFGLLLHELATNAQEHAFPAGGGSASIVLGARAGEIELRVSDEGVGMDEDGAAPGAVGLELVHSLVSQLRGRIERLPARGTSWRLSFPLDPAPLPVAG